MYKEFKFSTLCFIFRGGQPYSYCGINDREVCCFVPENAEPVGILPTPTRSRCGQKGFDTGSEGEADMAEWPWHVSAWHARLSIHIYVVGLGRCLGGRRNPHYRARL